MVRISRFLLLVVVGVLLFVPAAAYALVVYDDFESYTAGHVPPMPLINGKPGWESTDTFYGKGWVVTDDGAESIGHKYIRFWPSPWPTGGFSFDSNYATWHVRAPQAIVGLTLTMEYFVQRNGALKVFISGDNATWVEVTDRLTLIHSDPCFFNYTQTDLKAVIGDAHITTDVYVRLRAYANSGSYWVSAVDSIGLEVKGPMGAEPSGPQIFPDPPAGQERHYLTGQLHTHWMNDFPGHWLPDKTPQQLEEMYKAKGYAFVALTEHHPGGPNGSGWGSGRESEEVDGFNRHFALGMFEDPDVAGVLHLGDSMEDTASDSHILAVGFDHGSLTPGEWSLVGWADSDSSYRGARLDSIHGAGGLAFVAHPKATLPLDTTWSSHALIGLAGDKQYNGIEVFNGAAPWGSFATDKWTAVLHSQSNPDVYATAGDDYCPGWAIGFDTGSVTIVEDTVEQSSVSKAGIKNWLSQGYDYVSYSPALSPAGNSAAMAPRILGWWYDSDRGLAHIRFASPYWLAVPRAWFYTDRASLRDRGQAVTPVAVPSTSGEWEASFTCDSSDKWVRVKVTDSWGRWSLTQPIWLNPVSSVSSPLSAAVSHEAPDITGPVVLDLADAHLEVSYPQPGLSSVTGDLLRMDERPASAPPLGYVGYCYSFAPAIALAGENTLRISYDPADADLFPESALSIYWYDPGTQEWMALPSTVDTTAHTVSAYIVALGLFALSSDIVVDTTPPTIGINQPAATSISGQLQLQVTATDDNGVASVQFLLDDVLLGVATARGLGWGWPLDCSLFANGDHVLRMVATDAAGNSSEVTMSVTISGGVAMPVLTIASPSAGESFWNKLELQGTWVGQQALFGGVVMVDDIAVSAITITGSDWSAEVSIPGDLYGEHTITVVGKDEPGNSAHSSVSVIFQCFSDVPVGFWARDHIYATARAGIVQGYTEDDFTTPENEATYRPDVPVTRDQMAVYISRALAGGDANVPTGPATATFLDVLADYWAFPYVEYASNQKVVEGYSDGTYKPTIAVDRAQMAVFVARAIATPTDRPDLPNYTPPTTATFSDVPTSHWAYKFIENCKEKDVVQGYPDGTYKPDVAVTRDQMAVYVQRAFRLPM